MGYPKGGPAIPAKQYVSMAPIAAGVQAYQVCWIFKASGKPPFYDGKRRSFRPRQAVCLKMIRGSFEAALYVVRNSRRWVAKRQTMTELRRRSRRAKIFCARKNYTVYG
jgi:hypothetical protein